MMRIRVGQVGPLRPKALNGLGEYRAHLILVEWGEWGHFLFVAVLPYSAFMKNITPKQQILFIVIMMAIAYMVFLLEFWYVTAQQ